METAMVTAISGIQADALGAMTSLAPVAIAIFGAFFLWKTGKKFFNKVAN